MRRVRAVRLKWAVAAALVCLVLSSCSLAGDGDESSARDVVLVTYSTFKLPKTLISQFESRSGYHLVVRASGDAGELTNRLVLTKKDPSGDVAFGVDNTFGSRAVDAGVFDPYQATLPAGATAFRLPGDADQALTPVDTSGVCVNVDDTWFSAHHITPPSTLADLIKPAYRNLMVASGATTSSPGLAFLIATIGEFGADWPSYWEQLLGNGLKLDADWTDAYQVDFTQGGGHGDRPIVVSYDSDPAFTADGKGGTATSALLDTCFRQVEYAGVLAGASNPAGARAWINFMLTRSAQEALPDAMYVFPVDSEATLPADWARFAKQPKHPLNVAPALIARDRDEWLSRWTDLVISSS